MDIIHCGWKKSTATVCLLTLSFNSVIWFKFGVRVCTVINDKHNCINTPFNAENDNEGLAYQPLTCRVYMRKGVQGGVSQRHRVVMTSETISHYHQLEIQQQQ